MKKFKIIATNLVTLLRAVGVVALWPVFKLYGGLVTALCAAGCFLTDAVDGIMARKLDASTFFGSMFDGATDKAFLVANMLILLSISPYAFIPIILELGIIGIQGLKYKNNLNVQSNMVGKVKTWIAGIVVTLDYLLVDKNVCNFIGTHLSVSLNNFADSNIFKATLLPLVLSEIATLGSYFYEYKKESREKTEIKEEQKITEDKSLEDKTLKEMLFEPEFYKTYKDEGNLKLIRKIAKDKRK